MTSSRLVRGAKTRTIGCICLVLLLGALVYLFQGTQTKLADVQKIANTCSQQAESLSAQLEVLFEYKLRLEKSLQNEKQEKKKSIEELEGKLKEEREGREGDKNEYQRKLDTLTQEKQDLQMKLDEMKERYEKQVSDLTQDNTDIKNSFKSLKDDLDRVQNERNQLKESNDKLNEEIEKMKADDKMSRLPKNEQVGRLESDKKQLKEQLDNAQKEIANLKTSGDKVSPVPGVGDSNVQKPDDNKHALEPPSFNEGGEVGGSKGSSSTTPGINPQALYTQDSAVKTSTKQHESKAEPLAVPANGNGENGLLGQIPEPPDDVPNNNANNKSNLDGNLISNNMDWEDGHRNDNMNAAIEDLADAPLQGEDDKVQRKDYAEKDYKEDQADEDDDEEDRGGEQSRRESQLNKFSNMDLPDGGGGIMINPK